MAVLRLHCELGRDHWSALRGFGESKSIHQSWKIREILISWEQLRTFIKNKQFSCLFTFLMIWPDKTSRIGTYWKNSLIDYDVQTDTTRLQNDVKENTKTNNKFHSAVCLCFSWFQLFYGYISKRRGLIKKMNAWRLPR